MHSRSFLSLVSNSILSFLLKIVSGYQIRFVSYGSVSLRFKVSDSCWYPASTWNCLHHFHCRTVPNLSYLLAYSLSAILMHSLLLYLGHVYFLFIQLILIHFSELRRYGNRFIFSDVLSVTITRTVSMRQSLSVYEILREVILFTVFLLFRSLFFARFSFFYHFLSQAISMICCVYSTNILWR